MSSDRGDISNIIKLFRILRVMKLFRFLKLISVFNYILLSINSRTVTNMASLVRLFLFILLISHFFACIFFGVGYWYDRTFPNQDNWLDTNGLLGENSEMLSQYMSSLYWSIVTLFTTGYGDISATNIGEQIVCMSVIVIGTVICAYFINVVGLLMTEGDVVQSIRKQKLKETQAFIYQHKIDRHLTRALINHNVYGYKRNNVFDNFNVLENVPNYLIREIGKSLNKKYLLSELQIFDCIDPYICGLIGLKLTSIQCNARNYMYRVGHLGHDLYINRVGRAVLIRKYSGTRVSIDRGDCVGFESFINPNQYRYSIKAHTYCEFYRLSIVDIASVLEMVYHDNYIVWLNAVKDSIKKVFENDNTPKLSIQGMRFPVLTNQKTDSNTNNDKMDEKIPLNGHKLEDIKKHQRTISRHSSYRRHNKIVKKYDNNPDYQHQPTLHDYCEQNSNSLSNLLNHNDITPLSPVMPKDSIYGRNGTEFSQISHSTFNITEPPNNKQNSNNNVNTHPLNISNITDDHL